MYRRGSSCPWLQGIRLEPSQPHVSACAFNDIMDKQIPTEEVYFVTHVMSLACATVLQHCAVISPFTTLLQLCKKNRIVRNIQKMWECEMSLQRYSFCLLTSDKGYSVNAVGSWQTSPRLSYEPSLSILICLSHMHTHTLPLFSQS